MRFSSLTRSHTKNGGGGVNKFRNEDHHNQLDEFFKDEDDGDHKVMRMKELLGEDQQSHKGGWKCRSASKSTLCTSSPR